MIPRLGFGNTGHESTRLIFGAAALFNATPEQSAQALELLLESGINHIDCAASYGDAELRIGEWMPEHRDKFFLATKTGERSYAAARDQIRASLERMQTDRIDLIQLHNLVDEEEWETAFSDDGAVRAAIEARNEGLVKHIGVTGHGTRVAGMHLRSLDRFDFASVLLPYNHAMMASPEYADDFEHLVEICQERQIAVQTIKSVARRRWEEGEQRETTTWYKAFTDPVDITRAVHWALARPGVFVNSASDLGVLRLTIDAAQSFSSSMPPADHEMEVADKERDVAPLFIRGVDGVRA